MSFADNAQDRAEEAADRIKENVGEPTDDQEPTTQADADTERAGDHAEDAAAESKDGVNGRP